MTKWNLSITYTPKIKAVISGECRQTIRAGRKIKILDEISFHGWEGIPYRSKWSFRTPYLQVCDVVDIIIFEDGIFPDVLNEMIPWESCDHLANLDGITPPTGETLRDILVSMHTIPKTGLEAQIIRWEVLS